MPGVLGASAPSGARVRRRVGWRTEGSPSGPPRQPRRGRRRRRAPTGCGPRSLARRCARGGARRARPVLRSTLRPSRQRRTPPRTLTPACSTLVRSESTRSRARTCRDGRAVKQRRFRRATDDSRAPFSRGLHGLNVPTRCDSEKTLSAPAVGEDAAVRRRRDVPAVRVRRRPVRTARARGPAPAPGPSSPSRTTTRCPRP